MAEYSETPEIAGVVQAEYSRLLREAQDACARRIGSAQSIASADAAMYDLRFRVQRLDRMTDEQLAESAGRRTAHIGTAVQS